MRATLTVTAPEGPNGPCKVVVKMWDVARPELRKFVAVCNHTEGSLKKRSLLGGVVDIVCNLQEHSITLVKPAHDLHGLQSRFTALLGRSMSYRLTPLQAEARRLAAEGDRTPQEDRLEGYSLPDLLNQLYQAAHAAAAPPDNLDRKARRKAKSRTRLAVT